MAWQSSRTKSQKVQSRLISENFQSSKISIHTVSYSETYYIHEFTTDTYYLHSRTESAVEILFVYFIKPQNVISFVFILWSEWANSHLYKSVTSTASCYLMYIFPQGGGCKQSCVLSVLLDRLQVRMYQLFPSSSGICAIIHQRAKVHCCDGIPEVCVKSSVKLSGIHPWLLWGERLFSFIALQLLCS